ncbi:MAG TPA: nucleotidyltransferase family protein [Terriglobia bacterium]|nr:nucleotidyltransferase family protein [Terriglobia bacterium]
MIAGVILAAGESSRMGSDKALLPYQGSTFLESIVAVMRDAGVAPLVVVLGHHAREIAAAVKLDGVEAVVNPDYRRGQTSSLQAALRALAVRPLEEGIEAAVLALVDHPAVRAQTISQIVAARRRSGAPVVIPTYQGRRGHPVVIGRALFEEMLGLTPDQGANLVVRKYRDATELVAVDDPGVLTDIDDPQSYRSLLGGS